MTEMQTYCQLQTHTQQQQHQWTDDGWLDGLMDEQTDRQMDRQTYVVSERCEMAGVVLVLTCQAHQSRQPLTSSSAVLHNITITFSSLKSFSLLYHRDELLVHSAQSTSLLSVYPILAAQCQQCMFGPSA